jgi:hypothetical protein
MTDPTQPTPPMNKKDARANAAAAKAYSKSQRNWFMRHKILTALAALIVIIIAVSAGGGGSEDDTNASNSTDTSTSAPKANTPPKKAAPKPSIVTTSKAMIAVLEGNALKAKQQFDDKQVTVSGFVGSIDASGKYFALDPEPDAVIFTGVQIQIDDKFKDQVANFTKGQKITVTGKVTNVGEVIGYQIDAETIK